MSAQEKNIFVVGLDELNLKELEQLPQSESYTFHALCNKNDLEQAEGGSFNEILEKCERKLEGF